MRHTGTVREFHADEGWGVIDAPGVPGGCWVHFSALRPGGLRSLTAGQTVTFDAAPVQQDGYAFAASKVWTGDEEPPDAVPDGRRSAAYESSLTLFFDDGTVWRSP